FRGASAFTAWGAKPCKSLQNQAPRGRQRSAHLGRQRAQAGPAATSPPQQRPCERMNTTENAAKGGSPLPPRGVPGEGGKACKKQRSRRPADRQNPAKPNAGG